MINEHEMMMSLFYYHGLVSMNQKTNLCVNLFKVVKATRLTCLNVVDSDLSPIYKFDKSGVSTCSTK